MQSPFKCIIDHSIDDLHVEALLYFSHEAPAKAYLQVSFWQLDQKSWQTVLAWAEALPSQEGEIMRISKSYLLLIASP